MEKCLDYLLGKEQRKYISTTTFKRKLAKEVWILLIYDDKSCDFGLLANSCSYY